MGKWIVQFFMCCSTAELYFLTWDIKALIILIRYTSESISISCFAHLRDILNMLLKTDFEMQMLSL